MTMFQPFRIPLLLLLLVAGVVASPQQAGAQRAMHRIRFGETLKSISQRYYGTTRHADLLALVNGKRVVAGQYLRVPTAWNYVVPHRISLRQLARRLLADGRRAPVLIAFNPQLKRRRAVAKGTTIKVPFTVGHIMRSGDTIEALARAFYGQARKASLISEHNLMSKTAPSPGSSIEIPIGDVTILPQRLLELTNQRVLGVQAAAADQDEERQALREANSLLRRAEFWRVPLALIRLLTRNVPADSHIADVYRLLAVAYVALDRSELAVEAFREALRRQPSLRLDPVADSPKVIKAFVQAQRMRTGASN